jgi:hypothetical protein
MTIPAKVPKIPRVVRSAGVYETKFGYFDLIEQKQPNMKTNKIIMQTTSDKSEA